jgi:hypothetical protein
MEGKEGEGDPGHFGTDPEIRMVPLTNRSGSGSSSCYFSSVTLWYL